MTSTRTTPVQPSSPNAQTIIDMFELGWFGQGPPFWRWIETEAAQPYIRACAAMRRAPQPGDFFDALVDDPEMSAIEDPTHLAALAASIEAEYGNISMMDPRP
jgi:hypothetical protein